MFTTPQSKLTTFKTVVSHGYMKILFLVVILLLAVSFASCGILFALAPTNLAATTESGDFTIEVKDTTVQPVQIAVSHTFTLTTSSDTMMFDVSDGVYAIFYNISVLTAGNDQVFGKDSSLTAPITHSFGLGDTSDTEADTDTFDLDITPGKFLVRLESSHPVNLKVTQKYQHQGLMEGMLALGILSILLLTGVTISALKKRDAARRSSMISAFPQGHVPPPPSYYYGGANPGQIGTPYSTLPPPAPGNLPDPAARSSLEYVPGRTYTEFLCPSCGMGVLNRPVDGVVTCEHCGEQGRVY